jgi:hypothetical protein
LDNLAAMSKIVSISFLDAPSCIKKVSAPYAGVRASAFAMPYDGSESPGSY